MSGSSIHVFAGVNGSGKSSILGEHINSLGESFFNPDAYTKELMAEGSLSLKAAQSEAWAYGRNSLVDAINGGNSFAFETTLGGKTITRILKNAAVSGTNIAVYYIGLASVELNIQRVAERVAIGGHDIPIEKIRERWYGSIKNICTLLPHLHELRVYDNSVSVKSGVNPRVSLLLSMKGGILLTPREDLFRDDFPEWAKPIVAVALEGELI